MGNLILLWKAFGEVFQALLAANDHSKLRDSISYVLLGAIDADYFLVGADFEPRASCVAIVAALDEIWLPIQDSPVFAILKQQSSDVSRLVARLDTESLDESGAHELVIAERQTVFIYHYLSLV